MIGVSVFLLISYSLLGSRIPGPFRVPKRSFRVPGRSFSGSKRALGGPLQVPTGPYGGFGRRYGTSSLARGQAPARVGAKVAGGGGIRFLKSTHTIIPVDDVLTLTSYLYTEDVRFCQGFKGVKSLRDQGRRPASNGEDRAAWRLR